MWGVRTAARSVKINQPEDHSRPQIQNQLNLTAGFCSFFGFGNWMNWVSTSLISPATFTYLIKDVVASVTSEMVLMVCTAAGHVYLSLLASEAFRAATAHRHRLRLTGCCRIHTENMTMNSTRKRSLFSQDTCVAACIRFMKPSRVFMGTRGV